MASSIPLTYSLSIIFWWFHFIILPCSHYGALREYSHSIPSNRKFYIYDWPETLVNLWPNIKESTADMKVTSSLNYGTGMILNETIGMYDTFQFGKQLNGFL